MAKRIILCAFCAAVICALCSWVDPVTVNTYSGYIRGSGPLSGQSCSFYLDSHDIGITDTGELINVGGSVIHGSVLVGSSEYALMIFSNSQSEINVGGSWIAYDIVPEVMPASFPFVVYLAVFIALLCFVLLIFSIGRCFI